MSPGGTREDSSKLRKVSAALRIRVPVRTRVGWAAPLLDTRAARLERPGHASPLRGRERFNEVTQGLKGSSAWPFANLQGNQCASGSGEPEGSPSMAELHSRASAREIRQGGDGAEHNLQ